MNRTDKLRKCILSPYFLSLIALLLSGYTFWDNYFNFKLDVTCGRQAKVWVAKNEYIDETKVTPVILMSLAFTNSGGKTAYLDDVKLKVTLSSNNRDLWDKDFQSMREYDTFLPSPSAIKQAEILPIVIVGRTTEVKKYVFCPIEDIEKQDIPNSFDLRIEVYTKQRINWNREKVYEIKNLSDIWQDLDQTSKWNFAIKDIFEEK